MGKDPRVYILSIMTMIMLIFPLTHAADMNEISFSDDYNPFQLDKKNVTITGYVSTMYPGRGDWIYLVDCPYRDSPFYASETTKFNGILVKSKKNDWIPYTDLLITVKGKMIVTDGIDEWGNHYYFEIIEAAWEAADETTLTAAHQVYYNLVDKNILPALSKYINSTLATFRLDAMHALVSNQELNALIAQIEAVDETAFTDLIAVVNKLKTVIRKMTDRSLSGEDAELAIFAVQNQYMEWLMRFKI